MGLSERTARVVLSRVGEPGQVSLTGMVARDGAVAVVRRLREAGVGSLGEDLAARMAQVDPEVELVRADQRGIRFVIPGDDEWPPGLDDLRHASVLHERGGPPVGLWVTGSANLREVTEDSVAVVGSRSCTPYGESIASSLGADLGRHGHPTVSGAAIGIDVAAHRGSLAVQAPTVAVLASGVDRAYPASHRQVLGFIAEHGAVVSETPPGGAPMRVRFLARNRLIAALSQGTVVVEAALRSGALNTAHWAAGLGRPLMGVPGPVWSEPSAGVHEMIRRRNASVVSNADEVRELIAPVGQAVLRFNRAPTNPLDVLDTEARQLLDAVPVSQAADPTSIARTAGLSVTKVRAVLPELHDLGLVRCEDGRWRLAPQTPGSQTHSA